MESSCRSGTSSFSCTGVNWEETLAELLLAGLGQQQQKRTRKEIEDDDEEDDDVDNDGQANKPSHDVLLPKPVLSSTLRILWPAASISSGTEEGVEDKMTYDTTPPALSDLLGACDGVRIDGPVHSGGSKGRTLAVQAAGGRVLLARLLGASASSHLGNAAKGDTVSTLIVEQGAVPAMGLQLSALGTDQGLLRLMRAACCQRLGPGAAVRARNLPLTETRMKALEKAHYGLLALVEELEKGRETEEESAGMKNIQACMDQIQRIVDMALLLEKEVNEAFLLDLRPPVMTTTEGVMIN